VTRHRQVKSKSEKERDTLITTMIRKWTKEEDDDNDDGDVSRLIAINICIYIYI